MTTLLQRPGGATARTMAPSPGRLERHATLVSLALLTAGVALGLPLVGAQSIWFDEAATLSNAQQPYDVVRYMAADATPPLYPLLVHVWMRLFGVTIESARTLSVLASAAAVVLLFQTGRRFFDARTGLFAALLLLCSRAQIFFAHEARPYALVVLLCIAAFASFFALLEQPTRRRIIVLGVLDAALLYAHYVTAFALVAQGIAALPLLRRDRRAFASVVASLALAIVLVLPLALYLASIWPPPMSGWLATPTWWSFPVELAKIAGSEAMAAIQLVLALPAVVWLARGAAGPMSPRDRTLIRVLVLWVVVPLVAAFVVSQVVPVFLGRYLLYVAPGLLLIVAYVAARLPVAPLLRTLLVLALCALSLTDAWLRPLVRPAWRDAAAIAHDGVRRGAIPVVVPAHELLPFSYHFAPQHFRDVDHMPDLLRADGVLALPRLADAARVAATGREILILAPATVPGGDELQEALRPLGYAEIGRDALPHLLVLRFAQVATATPSPTPPATP